MVGPPPGVSSASRVPPICLRQTAGQRQAESNSRGIVAVPGALERLEDALAVLRTNPQGLIVPSPSARVCTREACGGAGLVRYGQAPTGPSCRLTVARAVCGTPA
jgi:hypothetical protein